MTREEILSHVDHTLLKPEATWPQTTLSVHDKITFDFERQSIAESFQSNLPWTAQRG